MLPRFSPLLRTLHPPLPGDYMAARILSRAFPSPPTTTLSSSSFFRSRLLSLPSSISSQCLSYSSSYSSSLFGGQFNALRCVEWRFSSGLGKVLASQRGFRKVKGRPVKNRKKKKKELKVDVKICIEEQLPDDPEILGIAEMLRLNVPMAMKLAFDVLNDSDYKTRDPAIADVGGFESIELSVLLCNDEFIRELNKDWRDEDHATDVLSMSQHMPELKLPMLMLGGIVISVETAAKQAEERGHTLLDEIRVLMIHGLLHLLGFDHELSEEAEAEMEKEEELLLKSLGWKGKGLIQSAYDAEADESPPVKTPDGNLVLGLTHVNCL